MKNNKKENSNIENKEKGNQTIDYSTLSDRELKKLASAGDAEAQFRLGEKYELSHKYKEAKSWYKSAVSQGHAKAMNALAVVYMNEDCDNYDKKTVHKLLQDSMSKNCPEAFFSFGTMYIDDLDFKTGLDYWKRSADLGYGIAARDLGVVSLKGKFNQPVDYQKAISWFEKAYNLGEYESVMYLCDIYAGLYSMTCFDHQLHVHWLNIEWSVMDKLPSFHEMPCPPDFKFKK